MTVAVVLATLFVDMLLYGLVVPVIPAYCVRLGAQPSAIGLLFASYGVALLAATPVVAALSRRVSRRALLLGGLATLAVSTLGFAHASSFGELVVARVGQGAAAAASWTAGLALIADVAPRGFGLASSASALGTLLGPPAGGWLADRWGLEAPFVGVAMLAALLAIAAAVVLVEPVRARTLEGTTSVLRNPRVRAISAFIAIGAALLGSLESMLPLDLSTRLHASASEIGLLFAIATIAFGVTSPIVGWAADRLGTARVLRAGWLATAALLPLVTLPSSLAPQAIAMAALGAALALIQGPALRALASAGADHAVAYAASNAAYAAGIMLGAALGGSLVGALGAFRGLAVVAGALIAAGIAPALTLTRQSFRPSPTPAITVE